MDERGEYDKGETNAVIWGVLAEVYSLETYELKIAHLLDVKTLFAQNLTDWQELDWGGKPLDELCQLEIDKLEKLRSVEDGKDKYTGDIERTLERLVMAFYFILKARRSDAPNTKQAKLISFLAGSGEEKIRQKLSDPFSRKTSSPEMIKKNMKTIRALFQKAGLKEITALIDDELEGNL